MLTEFWYTVRMTFTRTKTAVAAVLLAAFSLFGMSVAHAYDGPRTIHMSFAGGSPQDSNPKLLCNPTPDPMVAYVRLDHANRLGGTYALKVKESVGGGLVQLATFTVEGDEIEVGNIGPDDCFTLVFRNGFNGSGVVPATAYDVILELQTA